MNICLNSGVKIKIKHTCTKYKLMHNRIKPGIMKERMWVGIGGCTVLQAVDQVWMQTVLDMHTIMTIGQEGKGAGWLELVELDNEWGCSKMSLKVLHFPGQRLFWLNTFSYFVNQYMSCLRKGKVIYDQVWLPGWTWRCWPFFVRADWLIETGRNRSKLICFTACQKIATF